MNGETRTKLEYFLPEAALAFSPPPQGNFGDAHLHLCDLFAERPGRSRLTPFGPAVTVRLPPAPVTKTRRLLSQTPQR